MATAMDSLSFFARRNSLVDEGFVCCIGCSVGGFESFHASMSPEELFRKIFGDAGFNTSSGFGGFQDFAESTFGFAPAAEVRRLLIFSRRALCIFPSRLLSLFDCVASIDRFLPHLLLAPWKFYVYFLEIFVMWVFFGGI